MKSIPLAAGLLLLFSVACLAQSKTDAAPKPKNTTTATARETYEKMNPDEFPDVDFRFA
jgi:hypothetical protein